MPNYAIGMLKKCPKSAHFCWKVTQNYEKRHPLRVAFFSSYALIYSILVSYPFVSFHLSWCLICIPSTTDNASHAREGHFWCWKVPTKVPHFLTYRKCPQEWLPRAEQIFWRRISAICCKDIIKMLKSSLFNIFFASCSADLQPKPCVLWKS